MSAIGLATFRSREPSGGEPGGGVGFGRISGLLSGEGLAKTTRANRGGPLTDDEQDDPRLEEIQDEVDEIRRRLPDNPGLDIPDPDVRPVMPPEDRDDPGPPL
jgi:hypothetical protein